MSLRAWVFRLLVQPLMVVLFVASTPADATTSAPTPAPVPGLTVVQLDPVSLQTQVLKGNLGLYQQFLSLESAKNSVDGARSTFLPSLHLSLNGGLLDLASMVYSGPAFILSQVQFLLPFLSPANYFALDSADNQFYANVIAYKILELNTYSSALALYYTIAADIQAQQAYANEAANLNQLYQLEKYQQEMSNSVSSIDLQQAQENADLAQNQSDGYAAKVASEIASLQQALGLAGAYQLQVNLVDMKPSVLELPLDMTDSAAILAAVTAATKQAQAISPEVQQLNYLIQAGQDTAKQNDFGFISGATLTSKTNANGSADPASYDIGASVDVGFGLFPVIAAGGITDAQNKSQMTGLYQSQFAALQSALPILQGAVKDLALTQEAEIDGLNVYNFRLQQYKDGEGTLTDALTAHSSYTAASVARIEAEMNLNLQRVNLHRIMLDDVFATIKGCTATPQQASGSFWDIFFGSPKTTLAALCVEGGSTQSH